MSVEGLSLRFVYGEELILKREQVLQHGSFREKVAFDVAGRPPYAFGLLAAADIANYFGISRITAVEFGVADGKGLLELCRLAEYVTAETSIQFDLFGFDTGDGLPEPMDYRDHPEIWQRGDFTMKNREDLECSLPKNAHLIIGDIKDTIGAFVDELVPACPIGFSSFDVDLYSSSISCLKLYEGDFSKYLPVSIAYFDDTLGHPRRMGSLFRNLWAGQMLAINEFNERTNDRKIDPIRVLPYRRPLWREQWLQKIYGVHVLDHESRSRTRGRDSMDMAAFGSTSGSDWPL